MAKTQIDLKELLEAGVHFGHQSARWHPGMAPYLYTVKEGVHVFDLVKTKEKLEEALEFVRQTTAAGGQIVFVGCKRQAAGIVKEAAEKAGMPYVTERWLGGTLTNWSQMQKRLKILAKRKEERAAGVYKKYTKKEQLLIDREIAKLEKFFGGLTGMPELPAAVFIVDVKKESTAVREAKQLKIPVVGMVDSNSDPDPIDYVIPGNDDAAGSIRLIVETVAAAAGEGKKKSMTKSKE